MYVNGNWIELISMRHKYFTGKSHTIMFWYIQCLSRKRSINSFKREKHWPQAKMSEKKWFQSCLHWNPSLEMIVKLRINKGHVICLFWSHTTTQYQKVKHNYQIAEIIIFDKLHIIAFNRRWTTINWIFTEFLCIFFFSLLSMFCSCVNHWNVIQPLIKWYTVH